MALSVSRVYDALLELCSPWDENFDQKRSGSVGLYNLASRLFQSDIADGSNSLFGILEQLDKDLKFLSMFWTYVQKHSDAENVVRDSGRNYLLLKIEAVVDEIAKDLSCAITEERRNYSRIRPEKLLHLLVDFQGKTEHFKAEIIEVMDCLSGCSYQVYFYCFDDWTMFSNSLLRNLESIMHQDPCLGKEISPLFSELELMRSYVECFHFSGHKNVDILRDFLARVQSVTVRIANQSCNYWFNRSDPAAAKAKITALVDLQREMDPALNPDFLWLNLKLLKYFRKRECLRKFFCAYLLSSRAHHLSTLCWNLYKEVDSMVAHFANSELEDSREDVQSFFAEINAVLAEAAFRVRKQGNAGDCPSGSEIIMQICLLKVEFLLKEQTKSGSINEILEKLRRYFQVVHQERKEYWKRILALIEEPTKELESQCSPSNSMKIKANNSQLWMLFAIVFFKAESYLIWSLKSNVGFMDCAKDQIEVLLDEIKNFKQFVMNQLLNNPWQAEMIYIQVEAVARKVTFFSYSLLADNVTKEMSKKIILSLPELLDKVNHVKKQISPAVPVSNFPKTDELGFFDFLVKNLGELLKCDPESISPVKHHITEIQQNLQSLRSFLIKVSESDIEQEEMKDLGNHIINISYKVEYVVDSTSVDAHWRHFLWLYDLLEDIKLVIQQVSKIREVYNASKVQNFPQVSHKMILRDVRPAINEMVVDLCDEEKVVIDRLTRGSSQRDVVSLVGMPGIGKTTLAKKVYNHPNVMYHFHRRAWCTVSQVYEKRELLIAILSDIRGFNKEINHMNNEDLESNLRRCLLKSKYLIVMDDVWDIGAWNCLKNSLPDDMNGSRILITSRLHDVALEIKPDRDPHCVRTFTDDESWNLLEKNIFQGECCPKELLLVGKEIAQLCKGLPLAVVAIAGLLQKSEKRKDVWKKFSERLSSLIINDPETRCKEILELSYKYLPEYLKACVLYLGIFLEDKDIPVSKLTRFWIAEGFIPNTDQSKSLEDVAEDYLMDLINRNLVLASKRRSNGTVKACGLHDLLRDLCQSKAKEENYFQLITRYNEPYASFPDSDYGIEFEYDHLDPVKYEAYRLSISLRRDHFVDSKPSGSSTRSLIFFALFDSEPRCPCDISFICHKFKLLRVLDLECINMGVSFPGEIELLVHLRYLAVSGYLSSIPTSIAKLWKLETLVVKGLRGKVILPHTIWQMIWLRHLHVDDRAAFNLKDGHSFQLQNLVSFSSPLLSYGEDTEKLLKRLPNLCKLKCIFLESWDSSKNCNWFPILKFLASLESLKIVYCGRALNSGEFSLPWNLKKLTLSNFRLPWNHISGIGRLPNLRVLKLLSGAFEGQRWNMREEEFQELKFLKLDNLNIAEWNASSEHLPKLERLVLRNCRDLNKVPYDFAEITTLQLIEVQWCRQSTEESAKEIGEVTGEIKVLIN